MQAPPISTLRFRNTYRLIPSRFPTTGILDVIASPEDLDLIIELESWTNDRISGELGLLHHIPRDEWVMGKPMASAVMAAFCHPRPEGARFNTAARGAWYASRTLATAHAEVIYHRGRELAEIGVLDTYVQVRAYLADFSGAFADIREQRREFRSCLAPNSYRKSQELAQRLLADGANGIAYPSVRHAGGECLACFRPRLVHNVRQGAHFEYRWSGGFEPSIRQLHAA
jgi:RES domain-containing protein